MNTNSKKDSHENLFTEAIELRDSGNLGLAIEKLSKILEDKPSLKTATGVLGVMGNMYWDLKDYKSAAICYQKAVSNSPTSELASLGLFHSLWDLGDTDEAFEEMKRFLSLAESDEYVRLLKEIESADDSEE